MLDLYEFAHSVLRKILLLSDSYILVMYNENKKTRDDYSRSERKNVTWRKYNYAEKYT